MTAFVFTHFAQVFWRDVKLLGIECHFMLFLDMLLDEVDKVSEVYIALSVNKFIKIVGVASEHGHHQDD